MNRTTKMALAAVATTALVASARAQYNNGDLLLGFTTPSSTGDLVFDLGSAASIGVGSGLTLNLNDNGNLGLSASALSSQLTTLYGGLSGLSFGVVGGSYVNPTTGFTFGTVAHGDPAPTISNVGALRSSVNTVGQTIGDGSGPTANSAIANPNDGYGWSWTETINRDATGTWSRNGTNPNSQTPAGFTGSFMEDLYMYDLHTGTESFVGTISLASDGNVVFAAASVPEPSTISLLAGFGLLLFAFRRHSLCKSV